MNNKLRDVKKRAQQSHFKRRARERLGYALNQTAISGIRNSVQGEHGTLLAQPSLRISIWSVRYGERDLVVVYDHETEELVTLITTGMYQEMAICNSPRGKDADDLKSRIADTPAGKALQEMKERLDG
jgi:hypothetical protein